MIKKILALVLVLLMSVALFACNNAGEEEATSDSKINVGEESAAEGETGAEVVTGPAAGTTADDPGEYTYSQCNETVYVNNPGSAVTLRTETYEAKGSIAHGTSLQRIGVSTDTEGYWSKVIYNEETFYVATKFLTTYNINNIDEGFVAIDKIVVVNDETGSLNIRNIPTFEGSAVIGWAIAGEQTKVVAENATTGWYKVEFTPYGSTEKAFGYIKSGADNFVQ